MPCRAAPRKRTRWQIDMRVAPVWGGSPLAEGRGCRLNAPGRQGCRGASRGGAPLRQCSRPVRRLRVGGDPVARVTRGPGD
ncbi:hypothetical protein CJO78_17605 (plasmid) [Ralstonia solanacearum]|nr:hypothetical protein CJO78_17605 [Ralstonia solanacearum]AXW07660.1 hypothetical protein CJO82_17260 [Ralstonia solanacearum]AXW25450.1 hypothetical protein CJO86_17510 [Ralstonia solanacearum]AXW82362.1 hypothetical protein CJO98_17620 [Ralstonia solanacearum]